MKKNQSPRLKLIKARHVLLQHNCIKASSLWNNFQEAVHQNDVAHKYLWCDQMYSNKSDNSMPAYHAQIHVKKGLNELLVHFIIRFLTRPNRQEFYVLIDIQVRNVLFEWLCRIQ